MAGTIMVIMIFGLLISISTAYIKMVQTETQVQGMIDHSDRALDAAFSGVNLVMAVAQGQKIMFTNDASTAKERRYFIRPGGFGATDWGGLNILAPTTAVYNNATSSDWFYLNDNLSLFSYGDTGSSTKVYHFRVTSYPGTDNVGTIIPASYTIKAQGRFLVYSEDQVTVMATYTSQIIAECEINFVRKVIQLKHWRHMAFQTDNDFYKAIRY